MNTSFLEWLQGTSLAVSIGSNWFPYVESAHVIFLAVVIGTILTVDTRLLGWASRHLPFDYLAERLLPWTWGAFAGAVVTGLLMFIVNATSYWSNTPFLVKMALLLFAGANMMYFQLITYRGVRRWNTGQPTTAARAAGAISLVTWLGIVGFGRWIGFV